MITSLQKQLLQNDLRLLFRPDSHELKNHSYPVLSRYYDTYNKKFFYQKLDGDFEHIKIRLRTYHIAFNEPVLPLYLECKYKENDNQFKWRQKVDIGTFSHPMKWLHSLANQNLSFLALVDITSLVPSVHVYYERQAMEGWLEGQHIRFNFDSNLKYAWPSVYDMTYDMTGHSFFDHQTVIMEIKSFHQILPSSLMTILRTYSIVERRFSKYVESLKKISLLDGSNNGTE